MYVIYLKKYIVWLWQLPVIKGTTHKNLLVFFLSFLIVILHVRNLGISLTFLTINKVFFYIQKSHLSDVYNKTVHVHVLVKK